MDLQVCLIQPEREMTWKQYAGAVLLFNAAGWLLLYALQLTQSILPLNPAHLPPLHTILPSTPP